MTGFLFIALLVAAAPDQPFTIQVVDSITKRGVPLIELKTVNNIRYYTDSNGLVAFDEPGLMDQNVFFHVSGHGYEFPKDGFGIRGKAFPIKPGGKAQLEVKRINIAERLYRVTGAGIYRDTLLTGQKAPTRHPVLNGQVLGQDTVVNTVYRGKIYWFWGDTNRPSYPLGIFQTPGATSELPTKGGLDPSVGIDLNYWVDTKGFARNTTEMPGDGPTWVETLLTLTDKNGRERLYTEYVKVRKNMDVYARGLAVWDDEKNRFEKLIDIDLKVPLYAKGNTFRHTDGGREYAYFGHPFPLVRVPATAEAFADVNAYEGFTCLKEGTRNKEEIERDAEGKAIFSWKKNTPPLFPEDEANLIKSGKLKESEARVSLVDRDSGKRVKAHNGSVYWNEYRKKWIMIANEIGGKTSFLGEVWFAEADQPTGPWREAVQIATHDKMTFYNPKQHPMFDQKGGREIFFEGTYTHDFSGNPDITPRYEYNQMLYRLDLGDPRLNRR
jgi:hypothetical protein